MPLNSEEIKYFQNKLLKLKQQVMKVLSGVNKDVKSQEESSGDPKDNADEGADNFEKIISLELSSQETDIIKKIDVALDKIDKGTYGICDISGEEIPKKRLEAVPYASMTVAAQEKLEKDGFIK